MSAGTIVAPFDLLELLAPEDRGALKTRHLFGRQYLVDASNQRVNLCPACGRPMETKANTRQHDGWTLCYSCHGRITGTGWSRAFYVCTGCGDDFAMAIPDPIDEADAPVWEWNRYRREQQQISSRCWSCKVDDDDDEDQDDEDDLDEDDLED